MPLDVLFLTQTYPRFSGDGAGPFIRDLARGLVRGGDRVTVLAPHAAGLATVAGEAGVEVRTFRYAPQRWEVLGYGRSLRADERMRGAAAAVAPLYALGLRRALRRELRRRRYDLVHAHWLVPNGVALVGPGGVPRGVRLAIGLHGSDVFLAEKALLRGIARRALARAEVLTGCSPELVERICKLGFPPERAHVIPYGVDVATFSPDPSRRGVWRDRLGIPQDAPLLLGVGRMATKKGFHLLVGGLADLFARAPRAHVVLAGGGDRLEELRAAAAPFAGRVHFPGPVLHDTLPDLYRAADLFVLPAVHDRQGNVDGLPNVVLEAMASGLPVVASNVSGIPLAVVAGETGLLVPEGDRAALLDALATLLGDPERRAVLGAAGRRRAERELNWDVVASRYRTAYGGRAGGGNGSV